MAHYMEYTTTGKPHPYHMVRPSIWPIASAFAAGLFGVMMVLYMPGYRAALGATPFAPPMPWGPLVGFFAIALCMFFWWKDVVYESVVEKAHTKIAEKGLRVGMGLFISSEVMFFVAFFWAFFNASAFPVEAVGFRWPPADIHVVEAFKLPFLMTMILLLSGCTVTWAHHAILEGKKADTVKALGLTVALGLIFLGLQIFEYAHTHFGFTQGIYPSTFYMATGFHGFHVFVGMVFLIVCWVRSAKGHFTPARHFGFEAAAWYWHFVDVVWLFLFVAVYWWGNTIGVDHSALHNVAPAVSAGH